MLAWSQAANAQTCRLALVLALDVSGSVNSIEYAQQVNGLVSALNHPDVRAQILSGGGGAVALTVFEWSSRNHQFVIQPWIVLDSPAKLDLTIDRIQSHRKIRAGLKTALGTALSFAASELRDQSHCLQKTIDVSGDGENNIGSVPMQIYDNPAFDQITVNALVIGDPGDESVEQSKSKLLNYFETEVIHGSASFAMIAQGYDDYARAMRRKLVRELALPVLGWADF